MLFTILFGTWYINNVNSFPPIHHYYSPTVLASSACVILFIKKLCILKPLSKKSYSIVQNISAATFGAYFCHEIIRILLQNKLIAMGLDAYIVIAINFIVTLTVSFTVAYIASKIPYVSYLFCGIKQKRKV